MTKPHDKSSRLAQFSGELKALILEGIENLKLNIVCQPSLLLPTLPGTLTFFARLMAISLHLFLLANFQDLFANSSETRGNGAGARC